MAKNQPKEQEIDEMYFFPLMRKHGFNNALFLLEKSNGKLTEHEFFVQLIEKKSYLNEYFRVKQDLIDHYLIEYRLDENNNKEIRLTEFGMKIIQNLKIISGLLVEGKAIREQKKKGK